jgi:hypothetical protein
LALFFFLLLVLEFRISDMTYERLGEMFKGNSAVKCCGKFPLVLMGGQADPSSVRRQGARTLIDMLAETLEIFSKNPKMILPEYLKKMCSKNKNWLSKHG